MTTVCPKKLGIFLGELRAGADVGTATVVADMSIEAGLAHAAAEERGEYRDVVATDPGWEIEGDTLTFRVPPFYLHKEGSRRRRHRSRASAEAAAARLVAGTGGTVVITQEVGRVASEVSDA